MRRYWLWLLWQLLIRHWLGTVAICWGGRKQTVCHDLVELLPLHPPHSLCAQTIVSMKDRWHYIQRIKNILFGYTVLPGVKLLRQRLKLIRSSTILFWQLVFAALHTSHPLCMLIKRSLRGCRLMGCRAEPRKTWKQRNKRWGGLEEWVTGDINVSEFWLISLGRCITGVQSVHKERSWRNDHLRESSNASPIVTDSQSHCLHRHHKDLTHHSPDSRQTPHRIHTHTHTHTHAHPHPPPPTPPPFPTHREHTLPCWLNPATLTHVNITLSALVPLRLDAANLTMQRREDGVRTQHTLETQARVIPARTAASCQGRKKKKNPLPYLEPTS